MKRDEILSKAGHLIGGDRHKTYGDAATSHGRIAKMWSAYLSVEVSAVDVAAMCEITLHVAGFLPAVLSCSKQSFSPHNCPLSVRVRTADGGFF